MALNYLTCEVLSTPSQHLDYNWMLVSQKGHRNIFTPGCLWQPVFPLLSSLPSPVFLEYHLVGLGWCSSFILKGSRDWPWTRLGLMLGTPPPVSVRSLLVSAAQGVAWVALMDLALVRVWLLPELVSLIVFSVLQNFQGANMNGLSTCG